ncbi:MAG: hypothetical protein RMY29_025335 [Nostoc sp. CreGUA01]|nr:hypothetical protein [Nostoc sp. CreGUA01]
MLGLSPFDFSLTPDIISSVRCKVLQRSPMVDPVLRSCRSFEFSYLWQEYLAS